MPTCCLLSIKATQREEQVGGRLEKTVEGDAKDQLTLHEYPSLQRKAPTGLPLSGLF